jgi:hypothetical protein
MRKTVQDIVIQLVNFFDSNKNNDNKKINMNKISEETNLASVVINRYIDIFKILGKIKIEERISNRGIERIIDLSDFDLKIHGGK